MVSQSWCLTGVLRPGKDLMWCALTSKTFRCPSSRLNTGLQYTPVDSRATISTCKDASQSRQASRSAVIVENVRTWRCTLPSSPVSNTQATTFFLCTSIPQQRGYTTCIFELLSFARLQGARKNLTSFLRVLIPTG